MLILFFFFFNFINRLFNKFASNAIPRINKTSLPFKQMENISNYLKACEKVGLSERERFQTVDLYEGEEMMNV